jgi:Tannase and feruloyl esterase
MRLLVVLAVPLFGQTPCAEMARLRDVTAVTHTATHCQVSIALRPSADSEIKSEVWLPTAAGWNGKFLMVGGGGFVGSVNTGGMTNAVREGYATASTDTGHTGGSGSFALGHPEKIVDFAFRAVHETDIKAKALITAYYGRGPRLSYWEGCSTGGRQGLKLSPSKQRENSRQAFPRCHRVYTSWPSIRDIISAIRSQPAFSFASCFRPATVRS